MKEFKYALMCSFDILINLIFFITFYFNFTLVHIKRFWKSTKFTTTNLKFTTLKIK